ncbi:class I mannose-6-phosphate isomerase [Rhizobium sp. XQZ8]|uniref:class I mannose-6-phosphate isomerase n=1 Tax=Rhizobium populisoli TaxID=2859785 RepID=UPI001CA47E88|nr:class I mannose-6-phosphate isomerase [Rhizobium populisoli]MBW6424836.1 class I mannose-6-phosphate isomerase [Rhizobium populisoli]
MPFERATARVVSKPWGSQDLRPWSSADSQSAIGELMFDRIDPHTPDPSLLLKLLFTTQDLSIQVHPDDTFAQLMGMPNGKTEAWYVLSAAEGAQVAIGLNQSMTRIELRDAIESGSIADLVKWQSASVGDVFFVRAGTIHAIGAGLVIAEIQQRSDTTFRLFDHGRTRELHIDQAQAVANLEPTKAEPTPTNITVERMQLTSCPFFTFERLDLPPDATWELRVGCEAWAVVIGGNATIGAMRAGVGDVFFADEDKAVVKVGRDGVAILLAYADGVPDPDLLRELDGDFATRRPIEQRRPVVSPLRAVEQSL